MKKSKLFFLSLVILLIIPSAFLTSFKQYDKLISQTVTVRQDTSKWVAPESANELVNPITVDEDILMDGEMLYKKNCRSCHGKEGDGKGSGAADLSTVPTNFTDPQFLEQTDGSMFWKIKEGRGDMESYASKLSEEDIWIVISYIKNFAKSE